MKTKMNLTLGDRVILRDILRSILNDDDLRSIFRGSCVVTNKEIERLHRKLEKGINDETGAFIPSFKQRAK